MDPIGYAWISKICLCLRFSKKIHHGGKCTQNSCKLDNRKMQTQRFYSATTQKKDVVLFHFLFWQDHFLEFPFNRFLKSKFNGVFVCYFSDGLQGVYKTRVKSIDH